MYAMVSTTTFPLPAEFGIGMIGLGVMGRPMALNLSTAVASRTTVTITNRSATNLDAVIAAGAHWVSTPRAVAQASTIIVSMLPDLPELEQVLGGEDGLLAGISQPTILVISSTSSAEGIRHLALRLSKETAGLLSVVDAPVSGGEDGAIAGTLSIMVGGTDADVHAVLPVLETMGNPVHLGPLGSGAIAKFCNQLIVASTIMALGEAAVIAERSGLDLTTLFDLLEGGYAGSRVLQTRKNRIVTGDYSPSGVAKYMVKDLTFAEEEAKKSGTTAPQLQLLLHAFTDLTQRGFGDQDIAVTRAYIESLSAPTAEPLP